MKNNGILKIILIIIVFSSFIQFAKANIYGSYEYQYSGVKFSIDFYKNGNTYRIMLGQSILSDYGYLLYMSDGNFKLNKDTVILKDKYNNYIQKLLYKKGYMTAITSYKCFINKDFIKDKLSTIWTSMPKQDEITPLGELRSSFLSKHKDYHTLKLGTYRSRGPLTLILKKNHTFIIKNLDIVFFEGKWNRNKNELQFYDKNLKHNFYSLIDHKAIILLFFPRPSSEIRMTKG